MHHTNKHHKNGQLTTVSFCSTAAAAAAHSDTLIRCRTILIAFKWNAARKPIRTLTAVWEPHAQAARKRSFFYSFWWMCTSLHTALHFDKLNFMCDSYDDTDGWETMTRADWRTLRMDGGVSGSYWITLEIRLMEIIYTEFPRSAVGFI